MGIDYTQYRELLSDFVAEKQYAYKLFSVLYYLQDIFANLQHMHTIIFERKKITKLVSKKYTKLQKTSIPGIVW